MTEAMSRRDIEDVLTSIRRLVSHDAKQSAPSAQPERPGPSSEKLVLTSALRVDDGAPRAQGQGNPAAGQTADLADAAQSPDNITDSVVDKHASETMSDPSVPGFSASPDPAAPAQGRSEALPDNWSGLFDDPPREPESSIFADLGASVDDAQPRPGFPARDSSPRQIPPSPPPVAGVQLPKAESLLARIQNRGDHAAPPFFSPIQDAAPQPLAQTKNEEDGAPPLVAFRKARAVGTGVEPQQEPESPAEATTATESHNPLQSARHDDNPALGQEAQQSIEDASLEATLSRLEELLARSATPAVALDHPASVAAPPQAEAEESATQDPVIDEQMLFQLVANTVRQELQGELGEKITRNIRKLVRAEVARELALRKL